MIWYFRLKGMDQNHLSIVCKYENDYYVEVGQATCKQLDDLFAQTTDSGTKYKQQFKQIYNFLVKNKITNLRYGNQLIEYYGHQLIEHQSFRLTDYKIQMGIAWSTDEFKGIDQGQEPYIKYNTTKERK